MKAFTFLKDSIYELKRVKTPSKKELFKYTVVVCSFCFGSALMIWGMDTLITALMKLLFK